MDSEGTISMEFPPLVWDSILNNLDLQTILNCRLLSKDMPLVVDSYLERYSRHRPFRYDKQLKRQVWRPLHSIRKYYHEYLKETYARGIYFNSTSRMKLFMEEFGDYDLDQNPILTRSVSINLGESTREWSREQVWELKDDIVTFLKRFGEYIWYLELASYFENQTPLDFIQMLEDCLNHLPNLRRLYLEGGSNFLIPDSENRYDSSNVVKHEKDVHLVDKYLEENARNFPYLRELRTLHINFPSFPEKLAKILVSRHQSKLSRIAMPQRCFQSMSLPNLGEVHILEIWSKEDLNNLLLSLDAKQLSSLCLEFPMAVTGTRYSLEEHVFPWLKRFKKLSHFDISAHVIFLQENGTLEPAKDSIYNLKSLVIGDSAGVTYDFLVCLPNLEVLHLNKYGGQSVPALRPRESTRVGVVNIREHLTNLYYSNVWEKMAKLKFMAVRLLDATHEYNRDGWKANNQRLGKA